MDDIKIGDKVRVHVQRKAKNGEVVKNSYFGFCAGINKDGTYNAWYIDNLGSSFTRQDMTIGTGNHQVEAWEDMLH